MSTIVTNEFHAKKGWGNDVLAHCSNLLPRALPDRAASSSQFDATRTTLRTSSATPAGRPDATMTTTFPGKPRTDSPQLSTTCSPNPCSFDTTTRSPSRHRRGSRTLVARRVRVRWQMDSIWLGPLPQNASGPQLVRGGVPGARAEGHQRGGGRRLTGLRIGLGNPAPVRILFVSRPQFQVVLGATNRPVMRRRNCIGL